MSKSIVKNTKYLNAIASQIKNDESKQVASEIIKLYKNRNITNIATVEKLIKKLSSKKNHVNRPSKHIMKINQIGKTIVLRILKLLKDVKKRRH